MVQISLILLLGKQLRETTWMIEDLILPVILAINMWPLVTESEMLTWPNDRLGFVVGLGFFFLYFFNLMRV